MSAIKFGKRIRIVRKNAGCSQKEFCALLDIPQSTLSAYETDRMQPTVMSLINIATKFNVSLDWLCGIEKSAPTFIPNQIPHHQIVIDIGETLKISLDNMELACNHSRKEKPDE